MKVLVTGATGFIGGHVVRQLKADGHAVRCLVRSPSRPTAQRLANQGCELAAGDFAQPSRLEAAAMGVDAVVHLVGIISETRTETFQKVHVESTRALLAATKKAGIRRWLQMSALGTRPNAVARYHQSKWAAEELVRSSGLDWTIFRPSIVLGNGSGFERTFQTIAKWSPVIPVIGKGDNLLQPIQVEEVATAFSRALLDTGSIGQTRPLAGPYQVSFRELIKQLTGRSDRSLVSLPLCVAKGQAFFAELLLSQWLDRPSPLTRDQILMLSEDNVVK